MQEASIARVLALGGGLGVSLLVANPTPSSATTFTVSSSGVVGSSSTIGVVGENVEIRFSYDLEDFRDDSTNCPDPNQACYNAFPLAPVPISITGSLSGELSEIDPIQRIAITQIGELVTWSYFNGADVDDITNPVNFSGDAGSPFSAPFPQSFREAHNAFFAAVVDGLMTDQRSGSSGFFANDSTDFLSVFPVEPYSIVPEPSTGLLVGAGIVALTMRGRRD